MAETYEDKIKAALDQGLKQFKSTTTINPPALDDNNEAQITLQEDGTVVIKKEGEKVVDSYTTDFKAFDSYNEVVAGAMSNVVHTTKQIFDVKDGISVAGATVGAEETLPGVTDVLSNFKFYRDAQMNLRIDAFYAGAINGYIAYTVSPLSGASDNITKTVNTDGDVNRTLIDIDISDLDDNEFYMLSMTITNNALSGTTINALIAELIT